MITTPAAETWDHELDDLFTTIGHRFGHVEPRHGHLVDLDHAARSVNGGPRHRITDVASGS
ncbi:hypothetical protein [Streptomyces colonosanans]|uniref:Uncharacterized protein n=1 Tax=Streptomyces colonosanans TaxID=1428652 RepID=A0A1S2PAM4_9ACTN|nr:hypothetical protein [Streptomyces colonosanans]OIJ90455.1 hypothetical protein BIV24_18090 [Streptomyces colonosanans]